VNVRVAAAGGGTGDGGDADARSGADPAVHDAARAATASGARLQAIERSERMVAADGEGAEAAERWLAGRAFERTAIRHPGQGTAGDASRGARITRAAVMTS
jgi:hypothetical protein